MSTSKRPVGGPSHAARLEQNLPHPKQRQLQLLQLLLQGVPRHELCHNYPWNLSENVRASDIRAAWARFEEKRKPQEDEAIIYCTDFFEAEVASLKLARDQCDVTSAQYARLSKQISDSFYRNATTYLHPNYTKALRGSSGDNREELKAALRNALQALDDTDGADEVPED